jgi:hypothetical protein
MGGAILCPICGNNQAYCKCTRLEKEQFLEIVRLRGSLNVVAACLSEMEKGLEKHLLKLPPGPEGDGNG